MNEERSSVTKLEAAKRQLETGVRMFFEESDPIAIHTLVFAAHQILYDIGKKRGMVSILKGNPMIKVESRKLYDSMLTEAANFFKHGKYDSNDSISFNPRVNEYFLVDAAEIYLQLAPDSTPPIFHLMRAWFRLANPHIFSKVPETRRLIQLCEIIKLYPNDKKRFLVMEKGIVEAIKSGTIINHS